MYALNAGRAESASGWPAGQAASEGSSANGRIDPTHVSAERGCRPTAMLPSLYEFKLGISKPGFFVVRVRHAGPTQTPGDAGFGTLSGALSSDWVVTRAATLTWAQGVSEGLAATIRWDSPIIWGSLSKAGGGSFRAERSVGRPDPRCGCRSVERASSKSLGIGCPPPPR